MEGPVRLARANRDTQPEDCVSVFRNAGDIDRRKKFSFSDVNKTTQILIIVVQAKTPNKNKYFCFVTLLAITLRVGKYD